LRTRRRHQRFVRRIETEFFAEGKSYRAISSDFSRYGLFIRTNNAFVPGTELDIVIHLPNGLTCQLKGLVRWAVKTPIVSLKNGMGIELTSRDSSYVRFLKVLDPSETDEPCSYAAHKPSGAEQPPKSDHPLPPEFVIVACKECGIKNKVRSDKLSHGHMCGKCGSPISPQA
jgi:Tfp pilus assembly protein PilZ